MPGSNLFVSLSSLLAATAAFAIGISMILRDRSRRPFILFAGFCINLGLYHLASFFAGFPQLSIFIWVGETISLLLPHTAISCFSSFLPITKQRRGPPIRLPLLLVLLVVQGIAFIYSPILTQSIIHLPATSHELVWYLVRVLIKAYLIIGLLYTASRMWQAATSVTGTAIASRLLYLFYASLITLALGSPGIPGISPIITAVYLYFVAQTLQRERLLELSELLGRIASMTILVLAVTAVYALLILWVPINLAGSNYLRLFNIAVASFAVIVLFDPVRSALDSMVEDWLFRDRAALRRILERLRHRLLNLIDPNELVQVVIDTLRSSNRVTQAAFYLLDRQGKDLVLRGHMGTTPIAKIDPVIQRPLIEQLRQNGPVVRDILQRELNRSTNEKKRVELTQTLEMLTAAHASLALPILGRADDRDLQTSHIAPLYPDILGILLIDDERLLEPFAKEEILLFEQVVAQAAVVIQNSTVYEQRKERDRLADLGQMAAGLAHEIRNPLGAIKGAVQVVEPVITRNAPTAQEFLAIIVEEVERLNRVVTQFLRYSRPYKGEMVPVEVSRILLATLRLLPEDDRRKIELHTPKTPLPLVLGDSDALRQVFLNLIRNALDAIAEVDDSPGLIWIQLATREHGFTRGRAIAVSIRDSGPGLSPHALSNIFVPFHTSKSNGTGLGLPISQRIIEDHQGMIEVSSPESGGAQFTVLLPQASRSPKPYPAS